MLIKKGRYFLKIFKLLKSSIQISAMYFGIAHPSQPSATILNVSGQLRIQYQTQPHHSNQDFSSHFYDSYGDPKKESKALKRDSYRNCKETLQNKWKKSELMEPAQWKCEKKLRPQKEMQRKESEKSEKREKKLTTQQIAKRLENVEKAFGSTISKVNFQSLYQLKEIREDLQFTQSLHDQEVEDLIQELRETNEECLKELRNQKQLLQYQKKKFQEEKEELVKEMKSLMEKMIQQEEQEEKKFKEENLDTINGILQTKLEELKKQEMKEIRILKDSIQTIMKEEMNKQELVEKEIDRMKNIMCDGTNLFTGKKSRDQSYTEKIRRERKEMKKNKTSWIQPHHS